MAEPKRVEDFQYEPYEMPEMNPAPTPEQNEPKRQQPPYETTTEQLLVSPARHLKRLSTMEKFLLSVFLIAIVVVSIWTIQLRTNITQVEDEISTIQSQTSDKENDAKELEQEKNELSRTDRLKQIAEAHGLTINDDNLRTVK